MATNRDTAVLLIGLNLLLIFASISSQDANKPSWLLMDSSTANKISRNHNGSSINALNANSEDEPIAQTVSQSRYYYYQQRLFRPKVNLRISSEYGIVRQSGKDDDYYVYTTVGSSSSPNSIVDERDKERYSEKVIEPQQSALESPEYIEQYYSSVSADKVRPNANTASAAAEPSDSLKPRFYRLSNNIDPSPSSSLLDTSNTLTNDKNEKSNAIVENEPSSVNSQQQQHSDGVSDDDDYYYQYTDDDYQQQQYSHSFPDYTDDELAENEADQPEIHNQYFVKTKPRDVITQIETSVPPLTEDPYKYSYKEDYQTHVHEPVNKTETSTPTTMQESSDFYENESTAINKANNPHSMKFEMPPSEPTMASPQDESTKSQDGPFYGLMITPTIASNLIADVTRKFGQTDSTSIPGMPGIDYPILDEIPQTSFDCQKQRYKGFFADVDTKCQAWHYCDFIDGHSTFLCPNGTLFSQTLLTCDWWFNVKCEESQQLYVLNERLYRYIKAPKLSFPEDYHGPHVDDFLLEQLQLGLLPKIKKKVKDKVVIQAKFS